MGKKEQKKSYKQIGIYIGIFVGITLLGMLLCRGMYIIIRDSFYEIAIEHELDTMSIMQSMGSQLVDVHLRKLKTGVEQKAEKYAEPLSTGSEQERTELLSDIRQGGASIGYCFWSEDGIAYGEGVSSEAYIEQLDLNDVKNTGEIKVFDPDFDAEGNYVMAVAAPVKMKSETTGVFVELFNGFCVSEWISPMSFSLDDIGIHNNLGTCYIINNKGRDIAVSQKENYEWITSRYSAWELAETVGDEESKSITAIEKQAMSGLNGVGSYLWDNQTSYLAYGPITEADWAIGVGFYGREFQKYTNEAVDASGKVWMILMLGFTLFLGGIILSILRNLTKEQEYNEQLFDQKEELQQQALQITASEERFRLAMHQTGDIIIESPIDSGRLITYHFGNQVEYAAVTDERVKRELLNGMEMDEKSFRQFCEVFQSLQRGLTRVECTMALANKEKWYYMSVSAVTDSAGNAVRAVGLIKDVTKEHQGALDSLTGMLNKATMAESVSEKLRTNGEEEQGAFCILDLDRFKQVNDTYGHPVGDAVLLKVAEILKQIFPDPYLLGRLGGDEFCLLCPQEAGTDTLLECLGEARKQIREISIPECRTPGISCSCGVIFYTGQVEYEEIYRQADKMLYAVKEQGKDGCCHSEIDHRK